MQEHLNETVAENVIDETNIRKLGKWSLNALRGSSTKALTPLENNSALEFSFFGDHLVICFDTLITPNYEEISDFYLEIHLDGTFYKKIHPLSCPNEVRIIDSVENKTHQIRILYFGQPEGHCCRIVHFKTFPYPHGNLLFTINGEANFSLTDVRAILKQGRKIIKNVILRNWLTGQCSLLGIPTATDYTLEILAIGWQTYIKKTIDIYTTQTHVLEPIFLRRCRESSKNRFKYPVFSYPSFCKPSETFRLKFQAYDAIVEEIRLVRYIGPAKISRVCKFTEEGNRAGVFEPLDKNPLYYFCEGFVEVPMVTPAGLYDIEIILCFDNNRKEKIISCKCVCVLREFAKNIVLMNYGHMDAWGQYVTEHLQHLISIANILNPDILLIANACNPAYEAGALLDAEVPFLINFGNHQSPGKDIWFSDTIGVIDYGKEVCIVNFSQSWDRDTSEVEAILEERKSVPCKLIHCYEFGAPIEKILDKYQIKIVHDAHGPGPYIKWLGKTPTLRVGKINNQSFRIIRFKGSEPISYTYQQHASNPIPFKRHQLPPIRIEYEKNNDGTHLENVATIHNDLAETFDAIKLTFIMPRGSYLVSGGQLESTIDCDNQLYSILAIRSTLPANQSIKIFVSEKIKKTECLDNRNC